MLMATLDAVRDADASSPRLFQHRSPRGRDPQRRDFHRLAAGHDALAGRRREPGAHKLDHVGDREAVCSQDAFGAAVLARREQLEARGGGRA
jgi:hypothetical protein